MLFPRYQPGLCADQLVPDGALATVLNSTFSDAWPANYTQISSGLGFPFVLLGILCSRHAATTAAGFTAAISRIQIAIGASGSEQPIAGGAIDALFNIGTAGTQRMAASGYIPVTPVEIPASTRIAGRATTSAAAGAWTIGIYLVGYRPDTGGERIMRHYGSLDEQAFFEGRMARENQAYIYPTPLTRVAVTAGGTTFTYGAWAEVIAAGAIAHPIYVNAIQFLHTVGASNESLQWELGVGAGGSEQTIALTGSPRAGSSTFLYGTVAPFARRTFVPPGQRVAVRMMALTASLAVDAGLVVSELY